MEATQAGVEGQLHGGWKLPASPWAELEGNASPVLLPHVGTPPFKCRGAQGSCPHNRQNPTPHCGGRHPSPWDGRLGFISAARPEVGEESKR